MVLNILHVLVIVSNMVLNIMYVETQFTCLQASDVFRMPPQSCITRFVDKFENCCRSWLSVCLLVMLLRLLRTHVLLGRPVQRRRCGEKMQFCIIRVNKELRLSKDVPVVIMGSGTNWTNDVHVEVPGFWSHVYRCSDLQKGGSGWKWAHWNVFSGIIASWYKDDCLQNTEILRIITMEEVKVNEFGNLCWSLMVSVKFGWLSLVFGLQTYHHQSRWRSDDICSTSGGTFVTSEDKTRRNGSRIQDYSTLARMAERAAVSISRKNTLWCLKTLSYRINRMLGVQRRNSELVITYDLRARLHWFKYLTMLEILFLSWSSSVLLRKTAYKYSIDFVWPHRNKSFVTH